MGSVEGLHNRRFYHPRAASSASEPRKGHRAAPAEVSLERSGAIANRIQALRPTRLPSYAGRHRRRYDDRRTGSGSNTIQYRRLRSASCRDQRRLLEAAGAPVYSAIRAGPPPGGGVGYPFALRGCGGIRSGHPGANTGAYARATRSRSCYFTYTIQPGDALARSRRGTASLRPHILQTTPRFLGP